MRVRARTLGLMSRRDPFRNLLFLMILYLLASESWDFY